MERYRLRQDFAKGAAVTRLAIINTAYALTFEAQSLSVDEHDHVTATPLIRISHQAA